MISITSVVEIIISDDPLVYEGLKKGIINLSSYASSIRSKVEHLCKKPVKTTSITVALSRLQKRLDKKKDFIPQVSISSYSVLSNLCELTYEKTGESLKKLSNLDRSWLKEKDYLAISVGMSEVTIIIPSYAKERVSSHFKLKPKATIDHLAAVTVSFPDTYLKIPNTIFSLIYRLAAKRINIIEIISTYTELAYIVSSEDVSSVLQCIEKSKP